MPKEVAEELEVQGLLLDFTVCEESIHQVPTITDHWPYGRGIYVVSTCTPPCPFSLAAR
jgi:hypothetical protein